MKSWCDTDRRKSMNVAEMLGEGMSGDDIETAPQALRELAGWIVRDGVDSDHLADYMRRLLSQQFIELHASCRCEAVIVARRFSGLSAYELAFFLIERARELDRAASAFAVSVRSDLQLQSVNSTAPHETFDPICCPSCGAPNPRRQLLWVPELIAAIVCIAVCVLLLITQCGDSTLRVIAASGYGLLSLTYAIEGICSAWGNAHRMGDRQRFASVADQFRKAN